MNRSDRVPARGRCHRNIHTWRHPSICQPIGHLIGREKAKFLCKQCRASHFDMPVRRLAISGHLTFHWAVTFYVINMKVTQVWRESTMIHIYFGKNKKWQTAVSYFKAGILWCHENAFWALKNHLHQWKAFRHWECFYKLQTREYNSPWNGRVK